MAAAREAGEGGKRAGQGVGCGRRRGEDEEAGGWRGGQGEGGKRRGRAGGIELRSGYGRGWPQLKFVIVREREEAGD